MCIFKKNIIKQIVLDKDSTRYHIGDEVYASHIKGLFETNTPLKICGKITAIEFCEFGVSYTIESVDGMRYRCYNPTETTINGNGHYIIKGTYKFIENESNN